MWCKEFRPVICPYLVKQWNPIGLKTNWHNTWVLLSVCYWVTVLFKSVFHSVFFHTAPVCFSIKKPKETERLGHASAFPLEESSSGEDGLEEGEIVPIPQESRKDKCSERENSTGSLLVPCSVPSKS